MNSVQQARFSPGSAQKRTRRTNSDSGVIWAGSDTSQSASRPATPFRQSDSRSLAGPPIAPLSSAQSPLLSHPPDGECSLRSLAPPLPTKQMFHGGPFFGSLFPPLAALRRLSPSRGAEATAAAGCSGVGVKLQWTARLRRCIMKREKARVHHLPTAAAESSGLGATRCQLGGGVVLIKYQKEVVALQIKLKLGTWR